MKDLNTSCNFTFPDQCFTDVAEDIRRILENCLDHKPLALNDIKKLFMVHGKEKKAVLEVANYLRKTIN